MRYIQLSLAHEATKRPTNQGGEGAARDAVQQDIEDCRDVDYQINLDNIEAWAQTDFNDKKLAMYNSAPPKWGAGQIQTEWNQSNGRMIKQHPTMRSKRINNRSVQTPSPLSQMISSISKWPI